MKYLIIPTFVLTCVVGSVGQTIYITKAEWAEVMRGKKTVPVSEPKLPYRQITKLNSFEDGDTKGGYVGYITDERIDRNNGRFHRVERIGENIRSEEIINVGTNTFTRRDNGDWVAAKLPSRTKVIRPIEDPVNPVHIRKPNSGEILYVSLGERPYKGQTVWVYEEITRHVLIRTADKSEIHYENRTRFWIAADMIVRRDTNYVIFDGSKTTRILTSTNWELDPNLKPFEPPVK